MPEDSSLDTNRAPAEQASDSELSQSADRLTEALSKLESVASPDAYWYMDQKSGVFDRFVAWQERRKRDRQEAKRRGAEAIAIARQRERYKMRGEPRLTWEKRSQTRMAMALAGFVLACAALGGVIGIKIRQDKGDNRVAAGSARPMSVPATPAPAQIAEALPPTIPPELTISGGDSLDAFMPPAGKPTVSVTESPDAVQAAPPVVSQPEPASPSMSSHAIDSVPAGTPLPPNPVVVAKPAPQPGIRPNLARVRPAAPEAIVRTEPAARPAMISTRRATRTAIVRTEPTVRPAVITNDPLVPRRVTRQESGGDTNQGVVTIYEPPKRLAAARRDLFEPRIRRSAPVRPRAASKRQGTRPWRPTPEERRRIDRDAELAFQGEYRFDANRYRRSREPRRDDWQVQPLSTLDPKHPNWGWD